MQHRQGIDAGVGREHGEFVVQFAFEQDEPAVEIKGDGEGSALLREQNRGEQGKRPE